MIRFFNVYYPTRTFLLLLSEALIVSLCFLASAAMSLGPDTYSTLIVHHAAVKLGVLTLLIIACSYYFDLYEPQRVADRREIYFRILLILGIVSFLLSAALFASARLDIPGHVYSVGLGLMTVALLLWRLFYDWLVDKEIFRERVCILGTGEYARDIVEQIRSRKDISMEVVLWSSSIAAGQTEAEASTELLQRIRREKITVHRVVVAMQDRRGSIPVLELLELRFAGVIVEEAAALLERLSGKIQLSNLRPSSFLYSEGFRVKPSQQFARRVVSFWVAVICLVLLLPVFPLVALIVRLTSRGPIFFKQIRVGEGGRKFRVYKFRTMRLDAEADGAKWASKNDPRVTPIGMIMRKTRLDEIPQLWNVLKGEMGFVGPRPERPEFIPMLAEQLPFYDLRHTVRPGLTGWAQVRYGYGATLEQSRIKLEYDLYYVKHMSLGLDLLIMFETIKTVLNRRGAQ